MSSATIEARGAEAKRQHGIVSASTFGHVGMKWEWKSFADQVLDADCLGHWHEACAQRSMVLLTRM